MIKKSKKFNFYAFFLSWSYISQLSIILSFFVLWGSAFFVCLSFNSHRRLNPHAPSLRFLNNWTCSASIYWRVRLRNLIWASFLFLFNIMPPLPPLPLVQGVWLYWWVSCHCCVQSKAYGLKRYRSCKSTPDLHAWIIFVVIPSCKIPHEGPKVDRSCDNYS